jgi:hypothetical protein
MSTAKGDKWEIAIKTILQDLSDFLQITNVEGEPKTKMKLAGNSGAKWQCDLVALRAMKDTTDMKRVKIECKCSARDGIEQKELAAMAWSLEDTGAAGLIVVNKELQDGAQKVAEQAEIGVLEFTPGDSEGNYRAKLTNWFEHTVYALGFSVNVGISCTMTAIVKRADGTEEKIE